MTISTDIFANGLYHQRIKASTSIAQLFFDNVQQQPNSPAVLDVDSVMTYKELHTSALSLAIQLCRHEYPLEEPTGVLVSPGSWNIIVQLAVVYAGGTIVPVYPDERDHKMQSKLTGVGVRYLIVDEPNKTRLPMFTHIVLSDRNSLSSSVQSDEINTEIPVFTDLHHRTHILFTSGTTGEPKGVKISAHSLMHIIHHVPSNPLEPSDVMAHYIPTTFDYTLIEIWAPLIVGARIAILSGDDAFDGPTLEAAIKKQGVTVMIIVTALLNLVSYTNPRAFSQLRMVLFGGDAASPKAVARILEGGGPPVRLINAYGPTETCCYSLTQEMCMEDTHSDPVSIGKPTGDTIVYILDDAMQPVPDGQAGELFIGGPGVSSGYINRDDQNKSSFINVKDLPGLNQTALLYRTGDIVQRDCASGKFYYLGRRDHQVTIFTMRVELAAVKVVLMRTGRFADAVVLAIDSPIEDMDKILVAFVIPSENIAKDKVLEGIDRDLKPHLSYSMPHIEVIDRFPLNVHFKVDRTVLIQMYLDKWASYIQGKDIAMARTTEQRLEHVWAGVLSTPTVRFSSGDDFFRLIRSDFQGAYLVKQIQLVFGVKVSLQELKENSTLCMMAELIDKSTVT